MDDLPPFDDVQSDEPQGMPHSRQAEEAVIGAVLINPETYYDVAQFLRAEDFYIIRNRWIWEVFTELQERRGKLDYLTVCDMLENRGQLAEIGGPAYITAMINQTPTSMHAQEYGHIIEEASIRRRMLGSANDMARLAMDTARTVDTVLNEAEKSIFSISDRRATKEVQPIRTVLSAVYDRVDRLAQADDEIAGVPTGLTDLDKLLGGLQKSDLIIVAGRPGAGADGDLPVRDRGRWQQRRARAPRQPEPHRWAQGAQERHGRHRHHQHPPFRANCPGLGHGGIREGLRHCRPGRWRRYLVKPPYHGFTTSFQINLSGKFSPQPGSLSGDN